MKSSPVWRNRDFTLLWLGNGISLLGTNGARIAYPLLTLAVTESPVAAGWVTFASSVPNILMQLPAGLIADTRNRGNTMVVCQVGGLLVALVLALLVNWEASGFLAFLIVLVFIEGCLSVFFSLAEMGAVRDVVAEEQRPAALSLYEGQVQTTVLISRALGVILFGLSRWLPLLVNLLSYAVSVTTLAAVNRNSMRPIESQEKVIKRDIWEGAKWLWSESFLRITNLLFGATNMVWQCVILLFIVAADQDGQPSWILGVLLSSSGLGGLIGATLTPRLSRVAPVRIVFISTLWCWTGLVVVVAATESAIFQAIAWFGVGAFGAAAGVSVSLYRVNVTPPPLLGQVSGASQIWPNGAISLGALSGGYLIAVFGTSIVAWILVGTIALLALAGTIALSGVRISPAGDPQGFGMKVT